LNGSKGKLNFSNNPVTSALERDNPGVLVREKYAQAQCATQEMDKYTSQKEMPSTRKYQRYRYP
jgi:hypothetical protein